jgi:hypothetical protein
MRDCTFGIHRPDYCNNNSLIKFNNRSVYRHIMVRQALYYLNGKDVMMDLICTNPSGEKFAFHKMVHHNFKCYCRECGHVQSELIYEK